MPRVCSICSHPQRPEIDRALLASEPERAIWESHTPPLPSLATGAAILRQLQHGESPRPCGQSSSDDREMRIGG